jgi:hypothetical protein
MTAIFKQRAYSFQKVYFIRSNMHLSILAILKIVLTSINIPIIKILLFENYNILLLLIF